VHNLWTDAMRRFHSQDNEGALRRALAVVRNSIMREFHVPDWYQFDWKAADERAKTAKNQALPVTARIYARANLFLAGLVEDPVPFYMQVRFHFS
jgi:hypothetical protein